MGLKMCVTSRGTLIQAYLTQYEVRVRMSQNKAGYTTRHKSRRLGRGSNAQKSTKKKLLTDRQMDGPTDEPTAGRTHPLIESLARD